MSKFAKLFEYEDIGQVVVIMQGSEGDDASLGDEIRFFFQPENLGVCSMSLGFKDSDEGYAKCQDAFEKIDSDRAKSIIAGAMRDAGLFS